MPLPNFRIDKMNIHHKVSFRKVTLVGSRRCEICREPIKSPHAWQRLQLKLFFGYGVKPTKFAWEGKAHRCDVHAPSKSLIYPLFGDSSDDSLRPVQYPARL